MYLLSALFLVISGTAALTYQVSWVRLLGLSMGSTSASISTVLAAFFLGMALGSYATEKITRNRIHNLTPYILLEALIAISGLALLPLLLNLDSMMANLGDWGSLLSMKFVVTMAVLLVPTVCMGATFPVMAGIMVRQQQHLGLRVSQLYSLNTLGAVFGAVLSGFVFIPWVGLDGAIYIAVSLNLSIVVIGLLVNRRIYLPPIQEPNDALNKPAVETTIPSGVQKLAAVTLFATGFISIATEVGWTKYLSIFTGTTIYGFAAILAVFLFGIAFGSWFIKNYIQRIRHPAAFLALALIVLSLVLLLVRGGLSLVPNIYEGINHMSVDDSHKQLLKYATIFFLLLPPTFLLGLIFPLNLRLYCGDLSGVRSRVGKAYAINTLASILGSLAAGFWIIPQYGTDNLLTTMALLTLALGFTYILVTTKPVQRAAIASMSVFVLLSHFVWPHINYKDMISSVDYFYDDQAANGDEPQFLFLKEGKVSVISLVSYDGRYAKVQANGLNESMIDMQRPENALIIESLLAYLPYFLHPNPKSAFVVGYGGGITTRAFSHTDLDSIRVVELEPAVVDAVRSLENGPAKALDDPRLRLEFNDARNTLLIDTKRYDMIAAQASHPWLAGASNVFTEEFFQIAKSRLNEGGFYSQWVNLFRMDVDTLRSIFQAFLNTFPHVISFANIDTGDFMLLGSLGEIHYDFDRVSKRMQREDISKALAAHDVYDPGDLLWYFALSQSELIKAANNAVPNRDTNIFSEVKLSALSSKLAPSEDPYPFLKKHYKLDLSQYIGKEQYPDRLYRLGKLFLQWDSPDSAIKVAQQLQTVSGRHYHALQHKILVWQHNYKEAVAWFEKQPNLFDENLLEQMRIYRSIKLYPKARQLVENISAPTTRDAARAELAYYSGNTNLLRRTPAENQQALQWLLLMRLGSGDKQAASALEKIVLNGNADVEVIRKLTAFYLNTNSRQKANHYLDLLKQNIDARVKRYRWLIDFAMDSNNKDWAKELFENIKTLAPDHEDLPDLMTRLESSILKKDRLTQATQKPPL